MIWYVYCLRCRDGSLYTGVTTDPKRRLAQHSAGKGGAYTRSRRPVRMAVLETRPSRSSAQIREAEIKAWPREKKRVRWSLARRLTLPPLRAGGEPR